MTVISKRSSPSSSLLTCQSNKQTIERNRPCRRNSSIRIQKYETTEELIQKTFDGTCKYMIASGGTASRATREQHCGVLVDTGKPFLTRGISIPVPLNWIYYDDLRLGTLMAEQDNLALPFEEFLRGRATCQSESSPYLSFQKLSLFFVAAFTACGILFITTIASRYLNSEHSPSQDVTDIENGSSKEFSTCSSALELFAANNHAPGK